MLKNRLIGLIISGFKRIVFKINIILKFKKLVFQKHIVFLLVSNEMKSQN